MKTCHRQGGVTVCVYGYACIVHIYIYACVYPHMLQSKIG